MACRVPAASFDRQSPFCRFECEVTPFIGRAIMGRLSLQWQRLPVKPAELCIDTTLRCGQSFRWRKFDDEW